MDLLAGVRSVATAIVDRDPVAAAGAAAAHVARAENLPHEFPPTALNRGATG